MKDLLKLLTILGFATAVAACNTVNGVGQDVESVGEGVQEASEAVKREIND